MLDYLAARVPAGPPPRVLLIAAHPDDEAIGTGSRLARLAPGLTVAHVTDGAPADGRDAADHGFDSAADYAAARRGELLAALALAGVGAGQTREIGYVDQTAALHLPALSRRLAGLIADVCPDVVLTHPYDGGHPDHDAAAFAVAAASQLLARDGAAAPPVVEFACYHGGPSGLVPNVFPPGDAGGAGTMTIDLTDAERRAKAAMLACHATQRATLHYFPPAVERFRPAPAYDFSRPPAPGPAWYDRYGWAMTSPVWRCHARDALDALGLAQSHPI